VCVDVTLESAFSCNDCTGRCPSAAALSVTGSRVSNRLALCPPWYHSNEGPLVHAVMCLVVYLLLVCRSSAAEGTQSDRQCHLHFLRSPVAVVADEQGERVAGVRLELNELQVGWFPHIVMCQWRGVSLRLTFV